MKIKIQKIERKNMAKEGFPLPPIAFEEYIPW
jgi:hypothetical protein